MKQYCRYCAHLVYGDACFCEKKRWVKSYNSCKQPNKCKEFELNPIDALCENPKEYKPREKRIDVNQQTFFAKEECPTCKHFVGCEPSTLGICDEYEEEKDEA